MCEEEKRKHYLESAHVPWVSCILQAVLITLEEKFQKEPAREDKERENSTLDNQSSTKPARNKSIAQNTTADFIAEPVQDVQTQHDWHKSAIKPTAGFTLFLDNSPQSNDH